MAWYPIDSVSVANGGVVVSVTGNVDLSEIKSGWAFYVGGAMAEVKSGTASNGLGLSEIVLERPWEGVTVAAQKAVVIPTSGALLDALRGLEETNVFAIATHKALSDIATLDADVTIKDSAGNEHTFASLPKSARLIDESINKSDNAINEVNSNFLEKAASLTITAALGYKNAVEKASGGRNTLIIDDQGNENIMVVIPRFNCEDINGAVLAKTGVDMQLGIGTHPAFITNGVDRGEILIGKYLASSGDNGGCSVIGGAQPKTGIDFDTGKLFCANKGDNWHLMSVHEWAAISLWSLANGTVPRGNTGFGRAHDATWETARRFDSGVPGDVAGIAKNIVGSGPVSWSHDHSEFGVQDLVGNVWERLDQMKLEEGQIVGTTDNNPTLSESEWLRHDAYFDSVSSLDSGNVGAQVLSNRIVNRNGGLGDDSNSAFNYSFLTSSVVADAGYVENEMLRRLLIEFAGAPGLNGSIYTRNYGERYLLRGGSWSSGVYAGLGSFHMTTARTHFDAYLGFRPACFV